MVSLYKKIFFLIVLSLFAQQIHSIESQSVWSYSQSKIKHALTYAAHFYSHMSSFQKVIAATGIAAAGIFGAYYFKFKRPQRASLSAKLPDNSSPFTIPTPTPVILPVNAEIMDFDYERDMPFIEALLKEEWPRLYNETLDSLNIRAITDRFKKCSLAGQKVFIKVVRSNNQTVAFLTYFIKNQQLGHIDLLAVNKNFRGQGFASALIITAENDFRNHRISECDILVLHTNENAHRLYNKLGYQNPTDTSWLWICLTKRIL